MNYCFIDINIIFYFYFICFLYYIKDYLKDYNINSYYDFIYLVIVFKLFRNFLF